MKYYIAIIAILLIAASGDSFAEVIYNIDTTENISKARIPHKHNSVQYDQVVFSVPVDLRVGDIVMVNGQMEVTNDTGKLIMFCSYLVLSDSPTGATKDWSKDFFSRPLGTNIDPWKVHHHSEKISASVKMDHDFQGYMNFVIYTASPLINKPSWLTINQGYGNMAVTILRGM